MRSSVASAAMAPRWAAIPMASLRSGTMAASGGGGGVCANRNRAARVLIMGGAYASPADRQRPLFAAFRDRIGRGLQHLGQRQQVAGGVAADAVGIVVALIGLDIIGTGSGAEVPVGPA